MSPTLARCAPKHLPGWTCQRSRDGPASVRCGPRHTPAALAQHRAARAARAGGRDTARSPGRARRGPEARPPRAVAGRTRTRPPRAPPPLPRRQRDPPRPVLRAARGAASAGRAPRLSAPVPNGLWQGGAGARETPRGDGAGCALSEGTKLVPMPRSSRSWARGRKLPSEKGRSAQRERERERDAHNGQLVE